MPNGKRVEKFRENAKFTEQDVSKHLKTVTDVKVLQADGLIPEGEYCQNFLYKNMNLLSLEFKEIDVPVVI